MASDARIGVTPGTLRDIGEGLTDSYKFLLDAMNEHASAQEDAAEAEINLRQARDAVLLEHADNIKALGGNEDVREAAIRARCFEAQACADEMRARLMAAHARREVARIQWEYAKVTLRFCELPVFDAPEDGPLMNVPVTEGD